MVIQLRQATIEYASPPQRQSPTYGCCTDENVRWELDEEWDRRGKAWKAWREAKGTAAERGRRNGFARAGRVLKLLQREGVPMLFVTAVYTVTHGYSDGGTLCGLDWGSRPLKVPEGGLRG